MIQHVVCTCKYSKILKLKFQYQATHNFFPVAVTATESVTYVLAGKTLFRTKNTATKYKAWTTLLLTKKTPNKKPST